MIRAYSFGSGVTYDALGRLSPLGQPYLVANFKQAGLPLPKGVRPEDDLFAQAPEEIRREHSLHLVVPNDVESWLTLVEELRSRGALVVIVSDKPREELIKGLRLYWAWYARPQTIKMVLEQGSEMLGKGLLTGVRAVLVESSIEAGCTVYSPEPLDLGEGKSPT